MAIMKTALIFNPASGHGRSIPLLPKTVKWCQENQVDIKLYTTAEPGDGVRLGRLARLDGFERIVVLGGDGTVNEVGQTVAGTNIVLGVLPAGSGNDFFKMLNHRHDFTHALNTAFLGNHALADVGLVNGRLFFNAVGAGFDAYVAARAAEQKVLTGFLNYLWAVFRVWLVFEPLMLDIELDQLRISQSATLVSVGNGRSTGGGFFLTPAARLDDGLFDVCLIQGIPKKKIFAYLPRALKGTHVRLEGVRIYRSRRVVIRSGENFPVHVDGEIMPGEQNRLEITLDTRKLRVAVDEKFNEA
jgi:YegS/Rv2252/BmrU family lipid kinase